MYKVEIADKSFEVENKDNNIYIDNKLVSADMLKVSESKLHLMVNNKPIMTELISIDKENKVVTLMVNNQKVDVKIKDTFDLLLHDLGLDSLASKKASDVKAPMPGLVLKVLVTEGQEVKKGENLLVLEAMKMENMLKSSEDITIKKVLVNAGDKVEKNQVLIQL